MACRISVHHLACRSYRSAANGRGPKTRSALGFSIRAEIATTSGRRRPGPLLTHTEETAMLWSCPTFSQRPSAARSWPLFARKATKPPSLSWRPSCTPPALPAGGGTSRSPATRISFSAAPALPFSWTAAFGTAARGIATGSRARSNHPRLEPPPTAPPCSSFGISESSRVQTGGCWGNLSI
jgi:hypothetical protein